MCSQMHNQKSSRPYFNSLCRVSKPSITFHQRRRFQTLETIKNDEMLLCCLNTLITSNLKYLGTTSLNLKRQAASAHLQERGKIAKDPQEPYTYYTATTCEEFHELLCVLLEEFGNSLKQLVKIHKKATMPSMGYDAFQELIANAGLCEYAIQ